MQEHRVANKQDRETHSLNFGLGLFFSCLVHK